MNSDLHRGMVRRAPSCVSSARLSVVGRVVAAEDRRADDQHVARRRPCSRRWFLRSRRRRLPAAASPPCWCERAELVEGDGIELLAAEARHHAHHSTMSHSGSDAAIASSGVGGLIARPAAAPRARICSSTGRGSSTASAWMVTMSAPASRSRRCKSAGRDDHQVHVERQVGHAAHGLDDRHAVGDVRHEVAVHHVEVQGAGAGGFDGRTSGSRLPKSHNTATAGRPAGLAEFVENAATRHGGAPAAPQTGEPAGGHRRGGKDRRREGARRR